MLEVNDIVKVISATDSGYLGAREFIPIGTVCRVVNVEKEKDGSYYYEILPLGGDRNSFYYLESELAKAVWTFSDNKSKRSLTREDLLYGYKYGSHEETNIEEYCYHNGIEECICLCQKIKDRYNNKHFGNSQYEINYGTICDLLYNLKLIKEGK